MVETTMQQTSIKRFAKHLLYIPILDRTLRSQLLSHTEQQSLTDCVSDAEKGHRGEVCVVIENSLPLAVAYKYGQRARAIELFSSERVWDTEENTGVLIYINMCERSLDIVADRGINAVVAAETWQKMCDDTVDGIAAGNAFEALSSLVTSVGDVLRTHYELHEDPSGDEISNRIRYI